MQRFPALLASLLFVSSLAACAAPQLRAAADGASREEIAASYAEAIAAGMAQARAERERMQALSLGRSN